MELIVRREPDEAATPGRMYVGDPAGPALSFTLEDVVRPAGIKVAGDTAIPAGRYQVVLSYSPHFKMVTPEILHVPGFTSIRIHGGNRTTDTLGCVLVGKRRFGNLIYDCATILQTLIGLIRHALVAGELVHITIS